MQVHFYGCISYLGTSKGNRGKIVRFCKNLVDSHGKTGIYRSYPITYCITGLKEGKYSTEHQAQLSRDHFIVWEEKRKKAPPPSLLLDNNFQFVLIVLKLIDFATRRSCVYKYHTSKAASQMWHVCGQWPDWAIFRHLSF